MPFKGLIGFVTGGASGIGYQAIRSFLKYNMKAILFMDINCEKGEKVTEEICKEFGPGRTYFHEGDASNEECLLEAMCKTTDKYCNLDVVFNNAGIICEKDADKTIDLHYVGVVASTRMALTEFLPRFKTGACGFVLNHASITGINPIQTIPTETSSKHAVVAFSRAVGTDLFFDKYKVIVSTLCTGITDTDILKQGPPDFKQQIDKDFHHQKVKLTGAHCACVVNRRINGSVWVSENSKLYRICMPDRECLREPYPSPQ